MDLADLSEFFRQKQIRTISSLLNLWHHFVEFCFVFLVIFHCTERKNTCQLTIKIGFPIWEAIVSLSSDGRHNGQHRPAVSRFLAAATIQLGTGS